MTDDSRPTRPKNPADRVLDIAERLDALGQLAPAGYALALHLRFMRPDYIFQTYAKAWIDLYSRQGLVMKDPTVHWGFDNEGRIAWEALRPLDRHGVLDLAAENGLRHGVTFALVRGGSRSICSVTGDAAELSEDVLDRIESVLADLHDATLGGGPLDDATRDRLRRMSVMFTHP